jgi:hypothetical protein
VRDLVPASGPLVVVLDVVIPPVEVLELLTHPITDDGAPDALFATIVGSREIAGQVKAGDPCAPVDAPLRRYWAKVMVPAAPCSTRVASSTV